jgi:uncharacterized tellurite resistance protein B-like protein
MLAKLREFFDQRVGEADGADAEHRLHLATAMLLLEVSRADFGVDARELEVVASGLQRQFALDEEEVTELLALAQAEHEASLSLHEFLRLVNERFDAETRVRLVEDLWRVAYADDVLDKYEEYHIRKIADLLYVPHVAFIRAKHRVLDERAADGD